MKHVVWMLVVCNLFMSCKMDEKPSIIIAAASNTQFALKQITKMFSDSTGHKVDLIFGASGKFTTQLIEGAPYDIFLSANMEYPRELYRRGLVLDAPMVYAKGQLVMWSTDPQFKLRLEHLNEAENIAIANPTIAPYGLLTSQILKENKLWNKVYDALVFGENISQVNQYIESGVVNVGFTAKSMVFTPKLKNVGNWTDVHSNRYKLKQGLVLMKETNNRKIQNEFVDFLFSPEAQRILLSYGYTLPNKDN